MSSNNEFDFLSIASSKVLIQLSGGKDSVACLVKLCEHKIKCEAIHFIHNFSYELPTNEAKRICRQLNVKLHIIDIDEKIKDLFLNDFRLRPCRYCKGIMDKMTVEHACQYGFDYICVGDTLDDTMLVNRLHEMKEKNFFVAKYFNKAVELPEKLFILRPLIAMRSPEIYEYLAKNRISVRRVGDTGDKYFEYSREGCPLQFKDFGVPYTIDLMTKLKIYNLLCAEFASQKGIRASIHLPSEFIVTIPKGYESACREYLISKGCSLHCYSKEQKESYHYFFYIPIGNELTERTLLDIAFQRVLERESLLKNINSERNESPDVISYSFRNGKFTVNIDHENKRILADLTSEQQLNVKHLTDVLKEIFHRDDIEVFEYGRRLNILVFNNNFFGSYGSNQVFFQELCHAIENKGCRLFCASTFEEGEKILKSTNIDFSISFGQYKLQKNGVNFYDLYSLHHFQWISDNPHKMNIDEKSSFVHYIFIDDDFIFHTSMLSNRPLFLPLGYLPRHDLRPQDIDKRKEAILFPAQIRDIDSIEHEIEKSPFCKPIRQFLMEFDYDDSYIIQFNRFVKNNFSNSEYPKEFFSLTNSFTRTYKRIMVVSNIHRKKLVIAGRQPTYKFPNADHIEFLGEVKYDKIEQLMKTFKYVLNVDPNYHSCFHDRFVRCINAGAVCITNENRKISCCNGFSATYKFSALHKIDNLIEDLDENYDIFWNEQQNFVRGLDWENSVEAIANHWRGIKK